MSENKQLLEEEKKPVEEEEKKTEEEIEETEEDKETRKLVEELRENEMLLRKYKDEIFNDPQLILYRLPLTNKQREEVYNNIVNKNKK